MSDIVKRLRLLQIHLQDNDAGEAADTIEALRAENAGLREALKHIADTYNKPTTSKDGLAFLARKALGETNGG